jgi:hypothetical protein
MTDNKSGMSPMEINEIRPINPETAAHNIALAYIQSALKDEKLELGVIYGTDSTVTPIVLAYSDVYNFAYNLITHENKIIDDAE